MGKDEKEATAAPAGGISWPMLGGVAGALVAIWTLYGLISNPARDQARFEAEVRARLGQHDLQIAEARQQADADRKAWVEKADGLSRSINASNSETQSLRLQISDLNGELKSARGQLALILERVPRR